MWEYSNIDDTRQRLLAKGIIDLGGEVNEKMAHYVRDCIMILATNDNPDIRVIITSDGGLITPGLAIYDMLKNYPGRITGEVNAFCRSSATFILQGCHRRLANTNAVFNIHNVSQKEISLDTLRDRKKRNALIRQLEGRQKTINEIYQLRTGRSIALINSKSDLGVDMTAKEAMDFGLIDGYV